MNEKAIIEFYLFNNVEVVSTLLKVTTKRRRLPKCQKQPSSGVLRKMYSENMQQTETYWNNLALYWNHTSEWLFPCKLVAYFQNTFLWEDLWWAASECPNRNYRPKKKLRMLKYTVENTWKIIVNSVHLKQPFLLLLAFLELRD